VVTQWIKRIRSMNFNATNVLMKMSDIFNSWTSNLTDVFFISQVNRELYCKLKVNGAR